MEALLTAEGHAALNVQDKNGVTAIMAAALGGHGKTVEALLAAGARLDLLHNNGNSVAEAASRAGHEAIASMLTEAADDSEKDEI